MTEDTKAFVKRAMSHLEISMQDDVGHMESGARLLRAAMQIAFAVRKMNVHPDNPDLGPRTIQILEFFKNNFK